MLEGFYPQLEGYFDSLSRWPTSTSTLQQLNDLFNSLVNSITLSRALEPFGI